MSKNSRIILVPDIHQNIAWFKRIIEKEGHKAHYVLMGDYFDARGEEAMDDLEDFCLEFGKALSEIDYEALIGNHDALYFERMRECENPEIANRRDFSDRFIFNICGVEDSIARTRIIKKCLRKFLIELKTHAYVGGYLISHAGFNIEYFGSFPKIESILDKLYVNGAIKSKENNILTAIGYCRGGYDKVGGILWQDLSEFKDDLPQPQIFAHNRKHGNPVKIGCSWMIDIAQTYYGVYNEETKALTFEKV